MCWPTGQRLEELEKIKLAAIDPLRITTAEIGWAAHWRPGFVQHSKHSSPHGNTVHAALAQLY